MLTAAQFQAMFESAGLTDSATVTPPVGAAFGITGAFTAEYADPLGRLESVAPVFRTTKALADAAPRESVVSSIVTVARGALTGQSYKVASKQDGPEGETLLVLKKA